MKTNSHSVVAVFERHEDADIAVRALASAGIDLKTISVLGRGSHTEEQAVGFYNIGERVAFWGGGVEPFGVDSGVYFLGASS